jgi:hypothetical protein
LHEAHIEILAQVPATRGAAPVAAATEMRVVTFSTGNANQIVGITVGFISGAGLGGVSLNLPVGGYNVHWRVTGAGSFTLTCTGGTLAMPISSTAPDAGPIGITVA